MGHLGAIRRIALAIIVSTQHATYNYVESDYCRLCESQNRVEQQLCLQSNANKGDQGQAEVMKAYDYVLDRLGQDSAAGGLWQEYINFLAAVPPSSSTFRMLFEPEVGKEASKRALRLRDLYQKALQVIPVHIHQHSPSCSSVGIIQQIHNCLGTSHAGSPAQLGHHCNAIAAAVCSSGSSPFRCGAIVCYTDYTNLPPHLRCVVLVMATLTHASQCVLQVPCPQLEALWMDYERFETAAAGRNLLAAQRFVDEARPRYQAAKDASTVRTTLLSALDRDALPWQPRLGPSSQQFTSQLQAWREYLEYEKSNSQSLDPTLHRKRVDLAYEQALQPLAACPEV